MKKLGSEQARIKYREVRLQFVRILLDTTNIASSIPADALFFAFPAPQNSHITVTPPNPLKNDVKGGRRKELSHLQNGDFQE